MFDAFELLHFATMPDEATVIVLSRSGKSTEIIQLLGKLCPRRVAVIALTNTPDSPLSKQANVVLNLNAAFDHQVSISMYSALAMTGCLLAAARDGPLDKGMRTQLTDALARVSDFIEKWQQAISDSNWLSPAASVHFLGRGASLASCHVARLLWEEAAKLSASAMPTGGFRHGPQEIVRAGLRIALWIDKERMRLQDLSLARDLVLNLPNIPGPWQFLIDIIPIQIAAERLAHLGAQDCDSFRICSYIVEGEGGLIPEIKSNSSETPKKETAG